MVGTFMIGAALIKNGSDPVQMGALLIGAGLLTLGALMSRLSGTVKLTPGSIEFSVIQRLQATRVEAQRRAPDRVDEAVGRAFNRLVGDLPAPTNRDLHEDVARRRRPTASRVSTGAALVAVVLVAGTTVVWTTPWSGSGSSQGELAQRSPAPAGPGVGSGDATPPTGGTTRGERETMLPSPDPASRPGEDTQPTEEFAQPPAPAGPGVGEADPSRPSDPTTPGDPTIIFPSEDPASRPSGNPRSHSLWPAVVAVMVLLTGLVAVVLERRARRSADDGATPEIGKVMNLSMARDYHLVDVTDAEFAHEVVDELAGHHH